MKRALILIVMVAAACGAQQPAIVELNAAHPDIPLKITPSKSKPEALKRFSSIIAETQKEQDACQLQQRKVVNLEVHTLGGATLDEALQMHRICERSMYHAKYAASVAKLDIKFFSQKQADELAALAETAKEIEGTGAYLVQIKKRNVEGN